MDNIDSCTGIKCLYVSQHYYESSCEEESFYFTQLNNEDGWMYRIAYYPKTGEIRKYVSYSNLTVDCGCTGAWFYDKDRYNTQVRTVIR